MFIISKRYFLCISEILQFKIFTKKKYTNNHDSSAQISFFNKYQQDIIKFIFIEYYWCRISNKECIINVRNAK